jgi:DNA-binding transcriptional LysR family regulator
LSDSVELRHLRYFIAVAEELHFSRAALRLHISQPPLSHQIQHLEEVLQVRLLERDKHHVELTAAGRVFLEHARSLVQGVEAARDAAVRASRDARPGLRLGLSTLYDLRAALRLSRLLASREPPVDLEVQTLPTPAQLGALLGGTLDAAIGTPPVKAPGLGVLPLGSLEFAGLLPARHPLARQRSLPLSALGEEPLVLFPRSVSPECHDRILACCEEGGYRPSRIHSVQGGLHEFATMVQEGLGVAFWPRWVEETLNRSLRLVPIQAPGVRVALGLSFREPVTPEVEALQAALQTLGAESGAASSPRARGLDRRSRIGAVEGER